MGKLNDKFFRIVLRKGLVANINTVATKNTASQAELFYTTDTGELFIFNGISNVKPIVTTSPAPASAIDTGLKGQIAYDNSYVYVCIATNTWKRAALVTW